MNGADALCETLLAGGVDVCFANPGTSEMHFVAALDRFSRACAACSACSRASSPGWPTATPAWPEKPAATLLHCGPGLANGLANMHNAQRARTPMRQHRRRSRDLSPQLSTRRSAPMSQVWLRPMSHLGRLADGRSSVSADGGRGAGRRAIARARAGRDADPARRRSLGRDAGADRAPPPRRPAPWSRPEAVKAAARRCRAGGATMILLGHAALRGRGARHGRRIARASGARLLLASSPTRASSAAQAASKSRAFLTMVDQAIKRRSSARAARSWSARAIPVGFFAYPGKPGR
jgi:acetolactate synthase-1/2/3 large subunit